MKLLFIAAFLSITFGLLVFALSAMAETRAEALSEEVCEIDQENAVSNACL